MLALAACDWKLAATIGGRTVCSSSETVWQCDYQGTPCFYPYSVWVCATDQASAFVKGKNKAVGTLKPKDPSSVVIYACNDTGGTVVPQSIAPKLTTQDACGLGAGGAAPACGAAGDLCGLDNEPLCCSGVCSLSTCE